MIRKHVLDKTICWLVAILSMTAFGLDEDPTCGIPEIPTGTEIEGYSLEKDRKKSFTEGEQLLFQCRNGFKSLGPDDYKIICQKNGAWSDLTLECHELLDLNNKGIQCWTEQKQCRKISPIPDCSYNYQQTKRLKLQFQEKQAISFIQIHYLSPPQKESDKVKPQVMCYETEENKSRLRSNCQLMEASKAKECNSQAWIATYSCQDYSTEMVEIEFNVSVDVYSLSVFPQSKLHCDGTPEIPLNSQIQMERSKFKGRYTCNQGFTLIGNDTITCNTTTRRWQSAVLTCERSSNLHVILVPIIILLVSCILVIIWVKKRKQLPCNKEKSVYVVKQDRTATNASFTCDSREVLN